MKKILKSLPFQLLLGVVIGIMLGLVSNEAVMNVIVTVKFVLGELINFCVPHFWRMHPLFWQRLAPWQQGMV